MKKIIKYVVSFILIVICTITVILIPKIYYNSNDNFIRNNIEISELGVSTTKLYPTVMEVFKLMNSSKTLNMQLDNNITTEDNIKELAEKAISKMMGYLSDNKNNYLYYLLNFFTDKINEDGFIADFYYDIMLMSSELDDKFISATVVNLVVTYNSGVTFCMVIDYDTFFIYDLSVYNLYDIDESDSLFQVEEEVSISKLEEDYDYIINVLSKYWNVDSENICFNSYDGNLYISCKQ